MLGTDLFDPPIQLKFTSDYPPAKLRTPQEMLIWVATQQKWIENLRARFINASNPDNSINSTTNFLHGAINRRVAAIQKLIDGGAEQSSFETAFSEYVGDLQFRRLMHSESRAGKFISKLGERDISEALRVLAMYCNARFDISNIEQQAPWLKAATIAVLAERGLAEKLPDFDPIMEQFAARWDERFIDKERAQSQVTEATSAALAAFNLRFSEGDILIQDYRAASQRALIDGSAQLEAIRETYNTELTLQAPTMYWTSKRVGHLKAAVGWALGFALTATFGALVVWQIWILTAEPYLAKFLAGNSALPPSYGVFLPSIGAAFLVVWVLRILSRQLLSSFSLSSDAGERVAMVKTFLALMQRPDHVLQDDRILILSSLFRPSQLSGEDATPPNWFDVLMQRVNS